MRDIEALTGFAGRAPGTDAERRASKYLVERLEEMDRAAEAQPIAVFPNWPVVHALHCIAAVAASVVAVDNPILGASVLLLLALATVADLTGAFHLLRRLTGRRASQNVVSGEDEDKPGVLVLVAHYDAGRTGVLYGRRAAERRATLGRLVRRPLGLFDAYFWSLVLVLACAALRIAGLESEVLTAIQFVPTVVLIVHVPLFADIALSGVVPASNDNASGAAAVLELADRHGGRLEHFNLWVLLTGAGEGLGLGMRAWLREFGDDLDPTATVFLDLRALGAGSPRVVRRDGPLFTARYHPSLVELATELDIPTVVEREASDAYVARTRGFPALTLGSRNALGYVPHSHRPTDTPEHVESDALERGVEAASALVELIDERIGPELSGGQQPERMSRQVDPPTE